VDRLEDLLPLILPLLLIQVVLVVIALIDLMRPERRVRGGSKGLWVVLIVVLEMLGPLLYFTVGREEA
jgi:Phospholipase_D-nuclease N-terminal